MLYQQYALGRRDTKEELIALAKAKEKTASKQKLI